MRSLLASRRLGELDELGFGSFGNQVSGKLK